MSETQTNLPFEVVITKDGSPSLAFYKDGFSQMMHSTQGAFSETEYVYGKALDLAFASIESLQVLSVGLGFGYVEFSTAVRAIQTNKPCQLVSFEKEESLRSAWNHLLQKTDNRFSEEYKSILQSYETAHKLSSEAILDFFSPDIFTLHEALDLKKVPPLKANVILFDPFCAKFSPEFWQENDLVNFLQQVSEEKCIFATYAATGILTRALKQAGFKRKKQKGFAGKRESTLATKGL